MKLILEDSDNKTGVPTEVLKNTSKPEEYKKLYAAGKDITDPIKDALLQELNNNLFPKTEWTGDFKNREADRQGYIRALKKAISLLP